MDSLTMMQTIQQGIGAGVLKPNEGRADLNLLPVTGGDTPYLQQQNYSLEALAKRDAKDDPFSTGKAAPIVEPDADTSDDAAIDKAMLAGAALRKELGLTA